MMDSKSIGGDTVPVQIRPPVPLNKVTIVAFFVISIFISISIFPKACTFAWNDFKNQILDIQKRRHSFVGVSSKAKVGYWFLMS